MTNTPHLHVVALGSGSAGNATLVSDGSTTVLIDCGLSAREVSRRIEVAGYDPSSVSAILVTHEHSDHVRGIDVFCRRHAPDCAVYATPGTRDAECMDAFAARTVAVRHGDSVRIGGLGVLAFRTSHDAADPVGYRIDAGGRVFGLLSDTGVLTGEALEALRGCDVLGMECNHDPEMLDNGPYPGFLKRRIRSAVGHLANDEAGAALERLACDRLSAVLALHRSETNNTERLAAAAVTSTIRRLGLAASVTVARQKEPVAVTVPLRDAYCG
jgi:phosphoribosyl 1,2-cyclic phosphodiesterase